MKKMAKLITLLFMALAFCFVSCEPGVTPGKNPVENPGKDPAENSDKDPSEKPDGDSGNKTDDNQHGDPDAEDYPTTVTTPDGRLTVTYDPDGKGLLLTVRRLESDIGNYNNHEIIEHTTGIGIELMEYESWTEPQEPGTEKVVCFPFVEKNKKYKFELINNIDKWETSSVEYVSPLTAINVEDCFDFSKYEGARFITDGTSYNFKINKDIRDTFKDNIDSAFITVQFRSGDVNWKDTSVSWGYNAGIKNKESYESFEDLLDYQDLADLNLPAIYKLRRRPIWHINGTVLFTIENNDCLFYLASVLEPESGEEFSSPYYIDPANPVIEDSRFVGDWVTYLGGNFQTAFSAKKDATGMFYMAPGLPEPMKYKVYDNKFIFLLDNPNGGDFDEEPILNYRFKDDNTLEISRLEYPEYWNTIYRKGYEPKLPELKFSINFIGSSDVRVSYTVSDNGIILLSASEGFTSYQWKLGSIVLGSTKEIEINPDDYSDLDFFTISLVARKGSVTYSKQIDITKNIE
ncbi:MAG: hypothetical protein MJ185_06590 [Treponema sp.]|nr:hypothetical protein [Treponema sp.]